MPRTILLVEDDETLRNVLAEQLSLHGEFETQEAGTAGEAFAAMGSEQFDAVILDVACRTWTDASCAGRCGAGGSGFPS